MTAQEVLANYQRYVDAGKLDPVYDAARKANLRTWQDIAGDTVAALRAVLDLHPRVQDVDARDEPGERYYAIDGWWCGNPNCGIGTVRYPCENVRAITDALNGVTAGTGR